MKFNTEHTERDSEDSLHVSYERMCSDYLMPGSSKCARHPRWRHDSNRERLQTMRLNLQLVC